MIQLLLIKINQLFEKIKSQGILNSFIEIIFINKKIITFEKDLTDYKVDLKIINNTEIEIKNISKVDHKLNYIFPNKSRYLKVINNKENGFECFLFIRDNKILGDCWFATSLDADKKLLHKDIHLLKVRPEQKSAYMFDMYVKKEERGTNVSSTLLKYAYQCFKERGITKIYTYVIAHNTPAIWMVRTLGFKELNKLKMHRFFFYRKVTK